MSGESFDVGIEETRRSSQAIEEREAEAGGLN
jgi:hypothetical protein